MLSSDFISIHRSSEVFPCPYAKLSPSMKCTVPIEGNQVMSNATHVCVKQRNARTML